MAGEGRMWLVGWGRGDLDEAGGARWLQPIVPFQLLELDNLPETALLWFPHMKHLYEAPVANLDPLFVPERGSEEPIHSSTSLFAMVISTALLELSSICHCFPGSPLSR